MPEDFIKVTYSGLDAARKRIDRVQTTIKSPPLHKMVQGMAGIWQSNFDTEGTRVGGWRPLTQMTQDIRERRGFNPEHPILVQYGHLRRAAVEGLLNVNGPRVLTFPGVMMSYRPSGDRATLEISGPKVDNQFRIRDASFQSPARRFWFVDSSVEEAAAHALQQWLDHEVK
jgi:hypothetical protein